MNQECGVMIVKYIFNKLGQIRQKKIFRIKNQLIILT